MSRTKTAPVVKAKEPDRIDAQVVARNRALRQLRQPADLALDLAGELRDLGGGRSGLLALDADQQALLLGIGEPGFDRQARELRPAAL